MKVILAILACGLCSCTSTTFSVPMKVKGKDGVETVKSVRVMSTQADIVAPTSVGPQGITFASTTASFGTRREAVIDSKGNLRLDKAGNAVFNEYPIVPGVYHSTATTAAYNGGSFLTRALGSLVGTIGASLFGVGAVSNAPKPTL